MTEEKYRIVLHGHGLNGFQGLWALLQGFRRKNILRGFIDACADSNIRLYTIVSEYMGNDRGRIKYPVDDRLGFLAGQITNLPQGYKAYSLWDRDNLVAIVAERKRGDKQVVLLNGQTVVACREQGSWDDKKRCDHFVIGTNMMQTKRYVVDTAREANDRGLMQGAEHLCAAHLGIKAMGIDLAEKIAPYLNFAVEYIDASDKEKESVKEFAQAKGIPVVRVDNSHQFSEIGRAGILVPEMPRLTRDLIPDLKDIIKKTEYANNFTDSNKSAGMRCKLAFGLALVAKKIPILKKASCLNWD